jgi:deazaflavin-dependent oxidoreductase (nitroreductase family)
MGENAGLIDRAIARMLRTRWLMRLPIPLYRASLGWMLGNRLVMIEHLGRISGERRFAVVEVLSLEPNVVRVASGFGHRAQWYRNLQANGVAYISIGRFRRVKAHARLLSPEASAARLADYAGEHPAAWRHLHASMDLVQGGDAVIPVIEFVPPRDPAVLDRGAE